jgi:hypothetical protein
LNKNIGKSTVFILIHQNYSDTLRSKVGKQRNTNHEKKGDENMPYRIRYKKRDYYGSSEWKPLPKRVGGKAFDSRNEAQSIADKIRDREKTKGEKYSLIVTKVIKTKR